VLGPVTQVPLPKNAFDVVTQFGYLEHEWHPLDALRAAQQALRPGGITIIKVPNHSSWNRWVLGQAWSGYRFPDHCNYFTPPTLSAMLVKAGLRPLRASFLDSPPHERHPVDGGGKTRLSISKNRIDALQYPKYTRGRGSRNARQTTYTLCGLRRFAPDRNMVPAQRPTSQIRRTAPTCFRYPDAGEKGMLCPPA
jgi:SAM-dependent methyltransferase